MDFVINNKVELYSMDKKRIGITLIQDSDEKYFFIGIPLEKGVRRSLEPGNKIKFIYYEENRLYAFSSLVEGVGKENIILYKIRQPESFEVVQRREEFRLPIVIEMKYIHGKSIGNINFKNIGIEMVEERFKDDLIDCLSVDLSGRGIGLIIDENLPLGENLALMIRHPAINGILKGQIVHKTKLFGKNGLKYRIGVSFHELDYGTKEKIVGYIFRKMREQLKNRIE